jgi:hypothetical protein
VELNPVRAGLVKDPRDYRWSSYRAYAYGKRDSLVDEHPIYHELSEGELNRRKRYREFVRRMLRSKDAMRGEMERRAIYGSEGFAPRPLSKELLWKSREGPGLWASLVTELVWNEFGMRSSFTTILKGRRSSLSFLHRELDINLGGSGA